MSKNNLYKNIKKYLFKIRTWPVHPQWFCYSHEDKYRSEIGRHVVGRVLDIGCANQYMKGYLKDMQSYIGMDYYQTALWYETQPQVYGDAQKLPFTDESIDSVLLLDVLEHIPNPDECLVEISRVLKSRGVFVLKVPFLYPIHDDPLDFQRWTRNGLLLVLQKHGFQIRTEMQIGQPLETAGLLMNIAISKTVLNWFSKKNPALVLGIFSPILFISINFICWFVSRIKKQNSVMPHSYIIVSIRNTF